MISSQMKRSSNLVLSDGAHSARVIRSYLANPTPRLFPSGSLKILLETTVYPEKISCIVWILDQHLIVHSITRSLTFSFMERGRFDT